jgi:hypothetical protein
MFPGKDIGFFTTTLNEWLQTNFSWVRLRASVMRNAASAP